MKNLFAAIIAEAVPGPRCIESLSGNWWWINFRWASAQVNCLSPSRRRRKKLWFISRYSPSPPTAVLHFHAMSLCITATRIQTPLKTLKFPAVALPLVASKSHKTQSKLNEHRGDWRFICPSRCVHDCDASALKYDWNGKIICILSWKVWSGTLVIVFRIESWVGLRWERWRWRCWCFFPSWFMPMEWNQNHCD